MLASSKFFGHLLFLHVGAACVVEYDFSELAERSCR